jgi:hypothetical protein
MHLDTRLVHGLVQTTGIAKPAQTKPQSQFQMSWIDPSQKPFNPSSFSSSISGFVSSHMMHAITSRTRMKSIHLRMHARVMSGSRGPCACRVVLGGFSSTLKVYEDVGQLIINVAPLD